MSGSPLVSVVIPAYNAEAFILRAIRSVLNQTEDQVEVLVIDDASTDRTAEVVRAVHDSRVCLLQNKKNCGASASRNRAIMAAQAPWIALLDADDWYRPHRLDRLLDAAHVHNADLVADDIYFVPEAASSINLDLGTFQDTYGGTRRLERLFRGTELPFLLTPEEFVDGHLPGGNDPRLALVKPLMSRSFLVDHGLRYQTHVTQGEDYVFYLDCLGHGARFVLTGTPLYCYRVHDAQVSRTDPLRAQRERLRVNAELLRRPYVASSSLLRSLLERRHKELSMDVRVLQFNHKISTASWTQAVRVAWSNPSTLGHSLNRRVHTLARRFASRARNVPRHIDRTIRRLLPFGPRSSEGHAATTP